MLISLTDKGKQCRLVLFGIRKMCNRWPFSNYFIVVDNFAHVKMRVHRHTHAHTHNYRWKREWKFFISIAFHCLIITGWCMCCNSDYRKRVENESEWVKVGRSFALCMCFLLGKFLFPFVLICVLCENMWFFSLLRLFAAMLLQQLYDESTNGSIHLIFYEREWEYYLNIGK